MMAPEPLPDGFRKSAAVYRAEAEKTTDPETKARLLEAADRMQAIHDKARRIWADTRKSQDLVRSVLTPEHKTKGFWMTVAIMCLIVAGLFFLRYAG